MLLQSLLVLPVLSLVLPPAILDLPPSIARLHRTLPTELQQPLTSTSQDPIPIIVWHGLGDSVVRDGLKEVADYIGSIHPGTYVYLISPVESPSQDKQATFFGSLNSQIDYVCSTLQSDPILRTAPAVDAIGFSQGGQFLRGFIERCPSGPRVRSLITFGSQHNGISSFQKCNGPTDFLCNAANSILRSGTVWSDYVQTHLVPAQYYRNPEDYDKFLENSAFLADINNERELKNQTYKDNLGRLEKFVMVLFQNDTTVIPMESGWWAEVNITQTDDGEQRTITELRDTKLYKEDWLGLKHIDKRGGLVFETVQGRHMELHDKDLKALIGKYCGPIKDESKVEL